MKKVELFSTKICLSNFKGWNVDMHLKLSLVVLGMGDGAYAMAMIMANFDIDRINSAGV